MAQTAQLHIGHKAVRAKMLRQRAQHPVVGGAEGRVCIIGRVAPAIAGVVPAAVLRFGIEPIRDIHVALGAGRIADKAQHQMDALCPQVRKAVLGIDRIPRVNALFRFHLTPCQFQIPQRGVTGLCAAHHGRIADLRVGKGGIVRPVGLGLCQHSRSDPQQAEPCRQQS